MLFAAVFILLAMTATSTVMRFDKQDEYEHFLNSIDEENDLLIDRDLYGIDRHARNYVKCVQYNSTTSKRARNVRCREEGSLRPACFTTYDILNDELVQGCYAYQGEIAMQCEATPECSMYVLKKRIGFCCCIGERCNRHDNVFHKRKTLEQIMQENPNRVASN